MAGLSQDEARTVAEEAASKVLLQFFAYFDIDASDKKSLQSFRADLEYLRATREGTERLSAGLRKSMYTTVGAAILGTLYFMWTIFKDGFMNLLTKQ